MKSDEKTSEFDLFAGDYDVDLGKGISVSGEDKEYFAAGRIHILAIRLKELNFYPRKIMDFGCGTGSAIPYLGKAFPESSIVGAEVSEKSIDIAKERHKFENVSFCLLKSLSLEEKFDLVFCNGVFHHILRVERSESIKRIYNSLNLNGYFALWENNPWNPGTRLVMSRIPFDRDADPINPIEARKMLTNEKFKISKIDFAFYFPRQLKFLRTLEPLLSNIPLGAQYQILGTKP
jgi:SAM-dependent methyltransferase